ncbi:hypothetical protein KGY79_06385 [Candidatus Bipolaricaulota bacterium]|nr:hypothetical protein [Candidatus Bipolaricaulota bacterium]
MNSKKNEEEKPAIEKVNVSAEELTKTHSDLPEAIFFSLGVFFAGIGVFLLWHLYSGEYSGGFLRKLTGLLSGGKFREIISLLPVNLGVIGLGIGTLISIVKNRMSEQNKLLVQVLKNKYQVDN